MGDFTHKYSVLNGGVILLAHNKQGQVFGMVVLAAVTEPWDHIEEGEFVDRTAAVKHLCVSTKFRRGIGSKLLDSVERYAVSMQYSKVIMDTIQGMGEAAQALYLKRGWKGHEVSESKRIFHVDSYSKDFKWLGPCTNTFNRFNDYLEFFKENGYVVIPNILSLLSQIEKALCDFDTTLLHHGVDVKNDLKRTAVNARKLSSTHGAGGILDLFYPKWKIDLSLNNPFYCAAYQCLFQGTYGRHRSSRSQLWSPIRNN